MHPQRTGSNRFFSAPHPGRGEDEQQLGHAGRERKKTFFSVVKKGKRQISYYIKSRSAGNSNVTREGRKKGMDYLLF